MKLMIFRRDLRVQDNTALRAALSEGTVLACFIFDPRQVGDQPYRGNNSVQFMINSLKDLDTQIKKLGGRLYLFYGRAEEVVEKMLDKDVTGVYFNKDYTPFSTRRDAAIARVCEKDQVPCETFDDATLHPPGSVLKNDGTPYTVFTPFSRKAMQKEVAKPAKIAKGTFFTKKVPKEVGEEIFQKVCIGDNPNIKMHGGRQEALKILDNMKKFNNYKELRDIPAEDATTHLSAHNKFGTVSAREVYHAVAKEHTQFHTIITELHWRDFFTHIGFHFPHVFKGAFRKKYDRLKWKKDKTLFEAWCDGKTGFPIVDAGMRELNSTGYMHNRVRMIVASFLVKDLHIDWRWGERYFAQKLIDYDPAVNNGNWQWAASTGCDAQPYFRIFNPWRQQERFDAGCEYIKKWVPELRSLTAREIHKGPDIPEYPKTVVSHRTAAEQAKELFKSV